MTSRNRIPHQLEPYLRLPPEASLIVLTSTLGCSATWLTARFVSSLLDYTDDEGGETAVVLASWLRDASWWKQELRRAAGTDVAKSVESKRLTIVDFLCNDNGTVLDTIESTLRTAITTAKQGTRKVTLILENPDTLLALGQTTALTLSQVLLKLRTLVHATAVVLSADLPLLEAASEHAEKVPTPIEAETAAFAVQQAHQAGYVISVRELDTGAARDVSGVLRVTMGGGVYGAAEGTLAGKEMEALYLVQRDGNVKVFERGSATF
ncbi:hypothetical protein BAUCODRAFT_66893 [Baudoinia panamericana UAMH 10762]|uniref:Elongator complex protein 6 n=1 Tax=Baudoinia panamericana (strain UAMH 10762) TaxID=717646 RepID=M2LTJ5_BAUPA|nr:uncharacterized protein BAUCODRAFT_66893 [Baudoinia panamericana UAMH 10762]EMC97857.1 hypothetical protein BAUCODRAFT_66893 [Baudoinia panamericana UAMH 10762]